jgi:hypothetical protein
MASTSECARCARPDPTLGVVCPTCAAKVIKQLTQLADLVAEVETTVARQARYGPPTFGGFSSEPPEPANRTARDAAWAAGNTVVVWMAEVARLRGAPLPGREPLQRAPVGPLCTWAARVRLLHQACGHASCDAIRGLRLASTISVEPHPIARAARWLAEQLDWLRHREHADEAFGELEYAAAAIRRAVDTNSPRWYAGPCGGEREDGEPCDADLYGHVGAEILRCGACGSWTYAADRRAWLLDKAEDVLGTSAQLAAAATSLGYEGVTGARVRGYAHRGRIVAHGVDEWARPTYRFGDLLALLDVADTPTDQSRGQVA